MKYIIMFFIPLLLSANLSYLTNQTNEIAILESFDIEASFLYDPIMNQMRNSQRDVYSEQQFFKAMDEAYLFIPTIKNILSKYGIPPEFLFLAMAESSFSTKAYSVKRASGLWQFMPNTAKLYGLRIDQYVDERRDVIKSTEAAAKYLSKLYEKFGKWYLAAIAYNCGDGRLSRAIKNANSDELTVLLDPKKQYIPKESRFYIRKIVSLAMIGNDEQFLLNSEYEYLLNRANAYSISAVNVPSGESLRRVSSLINIPLAELQKLNRHLKHDFAPPYLKNYNIYIPYIKLSEFKQKYFEEKLNKFYKIHIVAKGDSLYSIGKKYNVSHTMIKDFNSLKGDMLSLNQKLIIPIDGKASGQRISSNFSTTIKITKSIKSILESNKVNI
ncbi:MAG: transglycosylase SLT domain-containing protein [Sulfurimonas sp.]|uniref:lytic transglycosylase domain-containing protein n=1 Tax=Sulfurimonas sp. TaxID=2022749 RepID=UPI00262B5053|nr:lytic transglycosylase domain-containing protein [Sulfurimonas sp.]MDD3476606.1 transglycosylase SLT domain-containing protein [Sulfurimonas sp.]